MPHSMRAQEYQVLLVTENEDGPENLERILAEECRHHFRLVELNCDLPIVAVTDQDSEDQAAELLATGVQDVLWRSELDADRLGRALRYAIDRAATLRELLESESMLHSILKNLTEGVIVADRQEKLLLVNPAARELLGLKRLCEIFSILLAY